MNPLLHFVWATTEKKAIASAAAYFASLPEPVDPSELVASRTGLTDPGKFRDSAFSVNVSEQSDRANQGLPSRYRWKVKPAWVTIKSKVKIVQERDEDGRIKLRYA